MQIEETKNINEMVDKAYTISQVWFREGTPKGWNSTNVRELGLLSDHRINETKMNETKKMGYDRVKEIIGAAPYDFRFKVVLIGDTPIKEPIAYTSTMPDTQLVIFHWLNKSNLIWDIYWGHSSNPPPPNTARKVVWKTDTGDLWEELKNNLGEYNSIISEKCKLNNLDYNQVFPNNVEKQKLRDWVAGGKVYYHVWEMYNIFKVFNNLQPEAGKVDGEGTVSNLDIVLKGLNIGNTVDFEHNDAATFDVATSPVQPIKSIIRSNQWPDNCIFCRWNYGNGSIYYVGDNCITGGVCWQNPFENMNVIAYNFVFGKYPTQASNVIKVKRAGILNSSIATIEVLLWQ
jgi:hypothetical protein